VVSLDAIEVRNSSSSSTIQLRFFHSHYYYLLQVPGGEAFFLLQEVPLFADVEHSYLRYLAERAEFITLSQEGMSVMSGADPAEWLYVIVSGQLELKDVKRRDPTATKHRDVTLGQYKVAGMRSITQFADRSLRDRIEFSSPPPASTDSCMMWGGGCYGHDCVTKSAEVR
jgi:hypothetical protein